MRRVEGQPVSRELRRHLGTVTVMCVVVAVVRGGGTFLICPTQTTRYLHRSACAPGGRVHTEPRDHITPLVPITYNIMV
jgi:hypothetical protein